MREPIPNMTKQVSPNLATAPSSFNSTSSATLLSDNPARLGATIYNEGAGTLNILFGTGAASSTNYAVSIVSGALYEIPYGYTGQIMGIFLTAGTARVQELY